MPVRVRHLQFSGIAQPDPAGMKNQGDKNVISYERNTE